MVAEQRETVQRIDADTLDIASNVGGAQRELLKYYTSISSNRWLMLKVFGVLIVFVRLFSLLLEDLQLTAMLAVFTLYLSIMTDFVQPWLRLTVVIYFHHVDRRYAPWTTYCLIHMHMPGAAIRLGPHLHQCQSFLSVCHASFPPFSPHDAHLDRYH